MRILRTQIALSMLSLLAGTALSAGPLRYVIAAETEVSSDAILLASLLPTDIPHAWRASAEKTSMGLSPQNGVARILPRESVLAALAQAGLPSAQFTIPPLVAVRRASRMLTRKDAFVAIQLALERHPQSGFPVFREDDISLEASVRVPEGDARLEVTKIAFDPMIHRARFRLCSRADASIVPFYATALVPRSDVDFPGRLQTFSRIPGTPSRILPALEPVLIKAGQTANLHLHSQDSSMFLAVKSLQSGGLDQTIRVRLTGSGKTLKAKIVSPDSLDAIF
jgi:hypothetical protein